jgi:hypothetical protein
VSLVIKDNKKRFTELIDLLAKKKKGYTTVGFHRDKNQKEEDGALIVDVALANEFGTQKIPARPFISTYFEENKESLATTAKKLYSDVLLGELDAKVALSFLGQLATTGIQKKIDEIVTPPNSPKTIKAKGSSKPLIDTGEMRRSVSHEEVI